VGGSCTDPVMTPDGRFICFVSITRWRRRCHSRSLAVRPQLLPARGLKAPALAASVRGGEPFCDVKAGMVDVRETDHGEGRVAA
jgi:hypothetical protein